MAPSSRIISRTTRAPKRRLLRCRLGVQSRVKENPSAGACTAALPEWGPHSTLRAGAEAWRGPHPPQPVLPGPGRPWPLRCSTTAPPSTPPRPAGHAPARCTLGLAVPRAGNAAPSQRPVRPGGASGARWSHVSSRCQRGPNGFSFSLRGSKGGRSRRIERELERNRD